mmetsp:Transcript_83288/g.240664  ORF Transcript_83288/g.240664 Transcript_83288/m.240664 type:complete len:232 (-) Transcript_83288:557-1252(-)
MLHLALRALHLLVGHSEGEEVDAEHQLPDGMLHGDLIARDVEAEHPGVLVKPVEDLELVCATDVHLVRNGVDGAVARNLARNDAGVLLVAADDVLHQHESHCVRAPPGHGLPPDGNVGCGAHLVVAVEQLGAAEVRLRRPGLRGPGLDTAEAIGGKLDELLVLHGAGGRDDHVLRGVVRLDESLQVGLCERADVVEGPDGRETERIVPPSAGMKAVVDHIAGRNLRLLEPA